MSAGIQDKVDKGRPAFDRDAARMEAAGWMVVHVAVETPIPSLRAIAKSFGWWLIRRPQDRYIVTYRCTPPTDETRPGA